MKRNGLARLVTLCALIAFWTTGAAVALIVVAAPGAHGQCCGDCNGDGSVTIDELITAVNVALSGCAEGPRFIDNGDGTVTDTRTELMWEKKDNLDGIVNSDDPHDADNQYTWSSSGTAADGTAYTDFLADLDDGTSPDSSTIDGCFADHCDWRLPTSAELRTIVLAPFPCGTNPCIDPIFGPTQPRYWSATTDAGLPTSAWFVFFNDGSVSVVSKTFTAFARAVRGGS